VEFVQDGLLIMQIDEYQFLEVRSVFFILKRIYEESIDMDCFLMNNLFMYIEVFIEQYSDLKYVFV
jgi:hypothetical protein